MLEDTDRLALTDGGGGLWGAPNVEQLLFEERDRIYGMFSQIAASLSAAFFDRNAHGILDAEPVGGDILQHVLDYTRDLLMCEKCALFLADLPGSSLVLERVSGEVDFAKLKDIATYDLRQTGPGSGVTPWVYRRRKPFNARNFDELRYNSEGHWKGNWDSPMYGGSEHARAKFQCVYMVPLLAGDRGIGVLKYENRTARKGYFDSQDERLIDVIAALVTNLIISQRIERNRYDRILPVISRALVSQFDKPSSYEELLETCRTILNADICSLFLVDDQNNLALECIAGVPQHKMEQLRGFVYEKYLTSKGLTSWILRKGTPFNVRSYPDLRGRSEGHHLGRWDGIIYDGKPEEQFKSLYSIPLLIGHEPIGVFKVENKNIPPYYFTESDERLFDLIGRLIAVGVRYAKTRETEQYLRAGRSIELGFLAAGISHEFNGYLQRMLSTSRLAMEKSHEEPIKEELAQIVRDISEATRTIDIFRTIRTPARGGTTFDLDEVLRHLINISRERFIAHSVDVLYENHGVGDVCLNPSEVQSILINLLSNAFDAVVETGSPGTIRLAVRFAQAGRFIVEIADSGHGISSHQRHRLFTPFHTTKAHGLGIGLFLAHRLVNNMSGTITVTSPNDLGGATFSVVLPLRMEDEAV